MGLTPKPHYDYLKDKWTKQHRDLQSKLWEKHKAPLQWISNNLSPKQLLVGSLGSFLLLAAPGAPLLPSSHLFQSAQDVPQKLDKSVFIVSNLSGALPKDVRELTNDEEKKVGDILTRDYGIKVSAELDGMRLNRSYGLIGAEQHLARYPGDTMDSHLESKEDVNLYYSSGMAPGLGAWGYFARSQAEFTQKDAMREKYYIAVQTFLVPGYAENVKKYSEFFKFRKMLVVNPNNGKAIIAVIGDAGPSPWTGKHLGGSPEVMHYLERVDGSQKGPVLYFFVDDPNDTIPLGPINPK